MTTPAAPKRTLTMRQPSGLSPATRMPPAMSSLASGGMGPFDGGVVPRPDGGVVGLLAGHVLARRVGVVELVEDVDVRRRQPRQRERQRQRDEQRRDRPGAHLMQRQGDAPAGSLSTAARRGIGLRRW